MRKSIRVAVAAFILAWAAQAPAQVRWYVTGLFDDGAVLSGRFDINQYGFVGNSYVVAGSGTTYLAPNAYGLPGTSSDNGATNVAYYQNSYTNTLRLRFADDLTVGSTENVLLDTSYECRGDSGCPYGTTGTYRYLLSGYATTEPLVIMAVPEPAAWTMMIAGLGLTGAALRRRRASPRFT